ncbi:hypothetical protein MMC13_006296 [Lambiella insularis]|nr:hypothetical protein [Lambiella insularis]
MDNNQHESLPPVDVDNHPLQPSDGDDSRRAPQSPTSTPEPFLPSAATPADTADIVVDEDWDYSDYNSDATSFMSRLSSSITNYQWENGRRYHAYQEGRYPLPNDETELDREDMKHHEMMLITDFRLHVAPLKENPKKILDAGTGTGIWAIQMAEKYPNTEVIGIDLSPVQPEWVPPNLVFEIDDLEAQWLYTPGTFDFIHCRFMGFALKDFPKLIGQAFRTLKSGGRLELAELDFNPQSYDNQLPPNSQILLWIDLLAQATMKVGMDIFIARKFKSFLIEAGFEDVTEEILELPWGGWPKNQRLKAIGMWHLEQLMMGLQGIAMALLTRVLGWSADEVEVFLIGLRKELKDKSLHVLDHM